LLPMLGWAVDNGGVRLNVETLRAFGPALPREFPEARVGAEEIAVGEVIRWDVVDPLARAHGARVVDGLSVVCCGIHARTITRGCDSHLTQPEHLSGFSA